MTSSVHLELVDLEYRLLDADPFDPDAFAPLLIEVFSKVPVSHYDLAARFDVSKQVILLWRNGETFPHPGLTTLVYDWLANKVADHRISL